MFKKVGDGLLAGLGAIVLTKEKINETTNRLVERGKLTKEEAEKLNKDLQERGETTWQSVEDTMAERMHAGRDRLGLASKDEVANLKERVDELEKKISLMESLVKEMRLNEDKPETPS